MANAEVKYLIYTGYEVIECADIDDMTEHANMLLHGGCKDIELVVKD
jgi:hypothetical protein